MKRMAAFHAKRKRRTAKATLKHGDAAKRSHRRPGGRTGSIRAKSTPPNIERIYTSPEHAKLDPSATAEPFYLDLDGNGRPRENGGFTVVPRRMP